jgi:putative Holliday junction resolvase
MGRLLGIDYGTKRCGIAVTDPLRIIASGLTTVNTAELFDFLKCYIKEEPVDVIVLGLPLHESGDKGQLYDTILAVGKTLQRLFPQVELVYRDERYTSRMAKDILLRSGVPKMKRRDKGLVDKISAGILLQEYLEHLEKHKSL